MGPLHDRTSTVHVQVVQVAQLAEVASPQAARVHVDLRFSAGLTELAYLLIHFFP